MKPRLIICDPGKLLTKYSIAVMPEKGNYTDAELKSCWGFVQITLYSVER
jgi:hypothetical protein